MAVRLMLRLEGATDPQPQAVQAALDPYGAVLIEVTPVGLLISLSPLTDLQLLADSVVVAAGARSAQWTTPGLPDPRAAAGAGYACPECGGVDSDHFAGCSRGGG